MCNNRFLSFMSNQLHFMDSPKPHFNKFRVTINKIIWQESVILLAEKKNFEMDGRS